jgi:hypothetical protein
VQALLTYYICMDVRVSVYTESMLWMSEYS